MLSTLIVKKLWAPLLAVTTGCLPFVVPPAKVEVGAGPATGMVKRNARTIRPKSVTELRAGFHPLDLIPTASQGRFDAGIGYGGDFIFGQAHRDQTVAHGPYLEASYFPLRMPAGDAVFRWGARGNLDLLYLEPRNVMGWGGTLVTELEITGHAQGAFADVDGDGAVFGTAWGQWSIGAFVGGSARDFPVSHYRGLTAGLSARIPFLAGIVCCAFFSGGSSSSNSDDDGPAAVTLTRRRHETRPATPVRSPPPAARIPTPRRDELKQKP